jgi:Alginate O-acetyl transferase AlgF
MHSFVKLGLFMFFIVFSANGSRAADDALYGAPPPPDSAYLRLINISANSVDAAKVGEVTFKLDMNAASGYKIIHGGKVAFAINAATLSADLLPQHNYSAVVDGTTITVIEDTVEFSKAKANLVFYNLDTAQTSSLATADKKLVIFKGVAPQKQISRQVNPLSIAFAVEQADAVVATTETVGLERGAVYSVIAYKSASGTKAIVVKNSLEK